MGYRIRVVPEVEVWLGEFRGRDPGAVVPPDTALLLAAGTERDWLRAWYAETILHCRDRYERHQTE